MHMLLATLTGTTYVYLLVHVYIRKDRKCFYRNLIWNFQSLRLHVFKCDHSRCWRVINATEQRSALKSNKCRFSTTRSDRKKLWFGSCICALNKILLFTSELMGWTMSQRIFQKEIEVLHQFIQRRSTLSGQNTDRGEILICPRCDGWLVTTDRNTGEILTY